jgi:hypothetical protein
MPARQVEADSAQLGKGSKIRHRCSLHRQAPPDV